MRKVQADKKSFGIVKFLNMLILVAFLAAVVVLVRMVGELRSVFDRDRYSDPEYSLQQGDYADLVRQYYYRYYDIAPFSSAHEESYHVAGYADAAFRHQFLQAIGDEKRAAALEERMKTERGGSGSLSVAIDDIDRLLANIPLDR